jgi:hypothetical protein
LTDIDVSRVRAIATEMLVTPGSNLDRFVLEQGDSA